MSEPLPEPPVPRTSHEPPDPAAELALARRNVRFGLLLFGVFMLLFAGTVVVAFIYLALD